MQDPRIELVDRLVTQLDSVLTLLEDAKAENQTRLSECWQRCETVFEELRTCNERLGDRRVGPELSKRLDHARRLHSVALSLAGRERDDLGEQLARVTDARRRMGASEPVDRAGESCDISA